VFVSFNLCFPGVSVRGFPSKCTAGFVNLSYDISPSGQELGVKRRVRAWRLSVSPPLFQTSVHVFFPLVGEAPGNP